MKYSKEQIESATKQVGDLKPGDRLSTIVTHVSKSGMSRSIQVLRVEGGRIVDVSWAVAALLEMSVNGRHGGINIAGCGMDMTFEIVYLLGRVLFPNGFGEEGTGPHGHKIRPPTKEAAAKAKAKGYTFRGRNGDTSGWETDGGYALRRDRI